GVDRARADRLGRRAGRVEVRAVICGGCARAPGVDRPAHRLPEEALDGGHLAVFGSRRWLEVRVPRAATRRTGASAAAALGVPERQAELPREVGAQEERQVRAVGL